MATKLKSNSYKQYGCNWAYQSDTLSGPISCCATLSHLFFETILDSIDEFSNSLIFPAVPEAHLDTNTFAKGTDRQQISIVYCHIVDARRPPKCQEPEQAHRINTESLPERIGVCSDTMWRSTLAPIGTSANAIGNL